MRSLSMILPLAGAIGVARASPKPLAMPIFRGERKFPAVNKRSGAEEVALTNAVSNGIYFVNASVGTPPQSILFQLDTGSSDVWMFNPQACQSVGCVSGSFEASESSTFEEVTNLGPFDIRYDTPGSYVSGVYFTDVFTVGDIQLTDFTMALAESSAATYEGIMGISFETSESISTNTSGKVQYVNSVVKMKNQGIIPSLSYSLYLDDLYESTGSIIFGGYDTKKFQGDLTVLDILDGDEGIKNQMAVEWAYFGLTDPSGTTLVAVDEFPLRAILDSGTSITTIPEVLFNPVAEYFSAIYAENYGGYLVDCAINQWEGSLAFGFGDGTAIIQIPFSELAIPLPGKAPVSPTGQVGCRFGLSTVPSITDILLGDSFLRSAYVIYNLEAYQIAIAQTDFDSTDSDIQAIPSGTDLASGLSGSPQIATSITAIPYHTFSNASVTLRSGLQSQITGLATTLPVSTTLLQGPTTTGSSNAAGTFPPIDHTSLWSSFLTAVIFSIFGL